ncbi:neprilysin-1-like [Physella acuta]|uniref:neprilysin-1-like n=1 Tax=Physella acuta TaxID=109671 RepID=UPI0027DB90DC|nr:neprilysin-1-like [Physella acuta]
MEAEELIKSLQASFNQLVDEVTWMDDVTKQAAKEKNNLIKTIIGQPDILNNLTFIDELYVNYTYSPDLYFENIANSLKIYTLRAWQLLRQPVQESMPPVTASDVNAYYDTFANSITLLGGILRPPVFKKTYPKYLNYGSIGSIIGHELTHGFDDQGRQRNKFGQLAQWWSQTSIENFNQQKKCIIEQYSNYTVMGPSGPVHLVGGMSQGENIADNGGLKESFRAYRNWIKEQGKEEPTLPGLNFTGNQLFFVSFAQIWCSNNNPAYLNYMATAEVHSPGQYRVIGSNQNSLDFSREFNCPVGSYMNRREKCVIW